MAKTQKSVGMIQSFIDKHYFNYFSKMVFCEPIEYKTSLIIPVAKVKTGFGYGYGKKLSEEEGEGGGLGLSASPIGYIEVKSNKTRFKRIRPHSLIPLLTTLTVSSVIFYSYRLLQKKL